MGQFNDEALEGVAAAIGSVAQEIKYLGNGDAATRKGAIEGLALMIREGFDALAESARADQTAAAITGLSEALQEGLYGLSNAVYALATAIEKGSGATPTSTRQDTAVRGGDIACGRGQPRTSHSGPPNQTDARAPRIIRGSPMPDFFTATS
jgi:hypothetical protein